MYCVGICPVRKGGWHLEFVAFARDINQGYSAITTSHLYYCAIICCCDCFGLAGHVLTKNVDCNDFGMAELVIAACTDAVCSPDVGCG